ncbi:MAG: hypothetical protein KIC80_01390 [Brachyspira sp.]|nr:hypothetical protein [Brachyspira sp.]
MKNIFKAGILTVFCVLFIQPAFATEVLKVESLSNFSTLKPPKFISFKSMSSVTLDENITIPKGVIVKGRLTEVKSPKRLKRNASFSVIPVSYVDIKGNVVYIPVEYIGKFSPKFEVDKVDVAKNAALTVGNHFVKGISMGYHAVEGAVKNEEGNRFKSSAVSVYENSPFSYIEKGSELEIRRHDLFSLRFKEAEGEDAKSIKTPSAQQTVESSTKSNKEVKVKEKRQKKIKKQKSDKQDNLIQSELVEEPHAGAKNETSAAMPQKMQDTLQPNEPEVHWVQDGVKGETFKFGRENNI